MQQPIPPLFRRASRARSNRHASWLAGQFVFRGKVLSPGTLSRTTSSGASACGTQRRTQRGVQVVDDRACKPQESKPANWPHWETQKNLVNRRQRPKKGLAGCLDGRGFQSHGSTLIARLIAWRAARRAPYPSPRLAHAPDALKRSQCVFSLSMYIPASTSICDGSGAVKSSHARSMP